MRILLMWVLLTTAAFGQITVPAETVPYTPIVATVATDIPDGATMDGGWTVSDGVNTLPCGNGLHVWAPPGKYAISFSGFWIHLGPEITVKDVNGVEQTFRPYLGHGLVSESAEFTVTGEVEPDPPDPPIPPPGKSWGLILEETGDSNAEWARLRVSLRIAYKSSKKQLLIFDQSNLPSSLSSIAEIVRIAKHPLPVLVVVGEDGEAVKILAVPDTVEGVQKEVGI